MKYRVSQVELQDLNPVIYNVGNNKIPGPPTTSRLSLNLTIEVDEYNSGELSSLENIETALRGETIMRGAPSYQELLREYHPEFLL